MNIYNNKSSSKFIILLATGERGRKPPPPTPAQWKEENEVARTAAFSSPLFSSQPSTAVPLSPLWPAGRVRVPPAAAASLSSAPTTAAPPPSCSGTEWRRGAALRKRRPQLDSSGAARSPSEAPTLWLDLGRGRKAGRKRGQGGAQRGTGIGIEMIWIDRGRGK